MHINFKKMNDTLFINDTSSDSETEIGIIDKQSKNEKTDIQTIIQKQIEEDLATHDFSTPHVTREEIQDLLKGIKIKNEGLSYLRLVFHLATHTPINKETKRAPD